MTSTTEHEVQAPLHDCIATHKSLKHFTAVLVVQQIIKVYEKYLSLEE